ncbi:hypothetical protein HGP17_32150 [Rhizobium sp. P38BS-XIX]|uniref:hypothetical protein n=1 Tax=Rhizobium sp. P38BS-XIX TaxID=2726740 RepID=UPI001456E3D0|nr:hypothetical protein [Rhizobium sp. P38BS-XIX]NLS01511.1 hypothetical protein [Rhizobium sp. P38BS-XIX]
MKFIWACLFSVLLPTNIMACTTAHGISFAAIDAGQVLIEGRIRSVQIDREKGVYAFDVSVQTTLKGIKKETWTILTSSMGKASDNLDAWLTKGTVYIGFDVTDHRLGIGQFRNDGCGPLNIVSSTPANLDKIRKNLVESSFW